MYKLSYDQTPRQQEAYKKAKEALEARKAAGEENLIIRVIASLILENSIRQEILVDHKMQQDQAGKAGILSWEDVALYDASAGFLRYIYVCIQLLTRTCEIICSCM
nr:unnamed protein product [Callosobruchus analis]